MGVVVFLDLRGGTFTALGSDVSGYSGCLWGQILGYDVLKGEVVAPHEMTDNG